MAVHFDSGYSNRASHQPRREIMTNVRLDEGLVNKDSVAKILDEPLMLVADCCD